MESVHMPGAARAWAMIDGRMHVIPEDVQAVLPSVGAHRLNHLEGDSESALQRLIETVSIP